MQIDPRGPRFSAVITTLVLAAVLVTGSAWLLAFQALVFVLGIFDASPYGLIYKRLVRPRLGPPSELEDAAPPRFAQGVGSVFAIAGLIGFATGITPLAYGATAAALLAAFLNAAFGLCLGCQMYLIIRRLQPGRVQ
ncbi:membrane protein [Thermobispora bispora]|jgi:hypothetical protein|uniref:DUF4395 domain-containing protein n=1 Tax=Thermobispora bispora (strain ATCC 19993 / DSM 43833 / CBS 139.67 / JCM 10125 / KCTC 9307 / NBRC 14880 / R51) TaxID=469371 RepID=D6Y4D3_THEBD|nr:DUF4395 domain-containing protein [Thermobispora bispora]MBO2475701.1 DUF4395 domain-containing protein [Actinomycetales bacterium]MDI9581051.1 DUF4395 domain-containing protein [Thermobispora sp.]ADG87187.1 hypothetical protein Tbis_0459 [Thermobispora bispora DSM 43833]MBX6167693.1 DUF4395 domain-containing protein [Thermobispora bispora]QSI47147.1 DUF4395 domain-containing protein [Thermobispora bispora]